jgi:hypothetical protein
MPSVYPEVSALVLAHDKCPGRRRIDVSLSTPSALLAFEN